VKLKLCVGQPLHCTIGLL